MKYQHATAAALAALTFVPCGAAHAGTVNWPQPGLNAQHTAYNQKETALSTANAGQLKQKWSATTAGEVNVPPVMAGGVVYTLSGDGNLYAVKAKSGQPVWTYPAFPSGLPGTGNGVAVANGSVFTTCQIDTDGGPDGGHFGLCALNAKTGAPLWTYAIYQDGIAVDSAPYSGPVVDNGKVFFGESDTASFGHVGYMKALDETTGAVSWTDGNCADPALNDCNIIGLPAPAVSNGMIIYETGLQNANQTNICARSEADGSAIWCSGIFFDTNQALTVSGDKVLFESETNGGATSLLIALNKRNGATSWQIPTDGSSHPYFAPAVADGVAYFSAGGGNGLRNLYAVSVANGHSVWTYTGSGTPGALTSGVSIANGVVYGQCQHGLCAFDAQTGAVLLSAGGGGSQAAPIVANGTVLTACNFNDLCRYKP